MSIMSVLLGQNGRLRQEDSQKFSSLSHAIANNKRPYLSQLGWRGLTPKDVPCLRTWWLVYTHTHMEIYTNHTHTHTHTQILFLQNRVSMENNWSIWMRPNRAMRPQLYNHIAVVSTHQKGVMTTAAVRNMGSQNKSHNATLNSRNVAIDCCEKTSKSPWKLLNTINRECSLAWLCTWAPALQHTSLHN